MPVWKMSAEDYYAVKRSERHHFVHANATTRSADKATFHMTFSVNVARMLRAELGVMLIPIIGTGDDGHPCPHSHPPEARIIPHGVLLRAALNAPGFNKPKSSTSKPQP